jgi:hypothetical protein
MRHIGLAVLAALLTTTTAIGRHPAPTAADYDSIQAALDANPGAMIFVPAGDHVIDAPLRIQSDGAGLYGLGRIVQRNPEAAILEIRDARGVRIRDLTFTRTFPARAAESGAASWEEALEGSQRPGIDASGCDGLEIEGVRVIDNKSTSASIRLEACSHARVRNCEVTNYKRLGVDDRTGSPEYGYAFRVIDGSGIVVTRGADIAIEGNRVVENAVLPSAEMKARHGLGQLVEGRQPTKKGPLAPPGDYANNWHQGSAIVVTGPEDTDFVRLTGNYIENAAQAIDLHCDHVICSDNLVNGAFMGVKSMHGSRNVIISNNNFSRIDLWGICLLSGAGSHGGQPATADTPARPPNLTAGTLVANNIFSDFGRGLEAFNWPLDGRHVFSLQFGQLPDDPPMTDILITGNIVYDTEAESGSGESTPGYRYAVFLDDRLDRSRFHFHGNLFHPGASGVSNVPLEP